MSASRGKTPDFTLPCPGEWITALTGRTSGKILVGGSDKGILRIWNLGAKEPEVRELKKFASPITALAMGPQGRTVLVGTWEGNLVRIALKDGKLIKKYEEHRETITTLDLSRDGKYLASGSADDRLIVWDLETAEDLLTMHQGNEYDVSTAAFSPDGLTLATGDGENQLKIWDAESGEEVRTLTGHREPVSQVAFDSAGTLISASWDKTIRVWGGEKRSILKGHAGEITALQVTPKEIVSASEDGTVRVWNSASGTVRKVLNGGSGSLRCLQILQGGNVVLAGCKDRILGWHINQND